MDEFGRQLARGSDDRRRDRSRSRDREPYHLPSGDRNVNWRERDSGTRPAEQKMSKSAIEAARKERMEMVKRLTQSEPDPVEQIGKYSGAGANAEGEYEEEDDDAEMRRMLGFGGFDSTKGRMVDENHSGASVGAVSKHKARKYRQYMNRRGGFNRSLEKLT